MQPRSLTAGGTTTTANFTLSTATSVAGAVNPVGNPVGETAVRGTTKSMFKVA